MLLKLIEVGAEFLAKNPMLVGMVIAAEEFVKKFMEKQVWFKGWHKIVLAFLLAALCVIPDFPPKFSPELVAQIVAVGGMAAGLFSAGAGIVEKINKK